MKLNRRARAPLLIVGVVACLVACGVGNDEDEAGGLTAFNVTPTSMTLTGPNATTCGSGFATRVYVNGGTAPYRVTSTLPEDVVVSRGTVEHPGEFFDITLPFANTCLTTVPVLVIDKLGRQATVTISSVKAAT